MFKDKISLLEAISYESLGDITIVDASPESLPPFGENGKRWKENFITLQSKYRHISPDKLLNFLSARYLIEVNEGIVDEDTNTYSWRYLHGVENTKVKEKSVDDIEYVYILVNPGYPSLVKIGMTIHDVNRRVTSINATATVEEWIPKFALPLRKGKAFQVEQAVHKFFDPVRVSSDLGNSREFFTLDPLTAFDKVREVGAMFMVGNPITY
jgi:hypothetical protein